MKAITATPASIKEVFQKDYLIPNFQRPYSWGKTSARNYGVIYWISMNMDFHVEKAHLKILLRKAT